MFTTITGTFENSKIYLSDELPVCLTRAKVIVIFQPEDDDEKTDDKQIFEGKAVIPVEFSKSPGI